MRIDVMTVGADGEFTVPPKEALEKMPLHNLAALCREDWKKVYFGAVPYLDALSTVSALSDPYGAEDGETLVIYFLANANSWRGDMARAVKAELKRRLKEKG